MATQVKELKEIQEVIKKNLPAHVSETLKSELEDLAGYRASEPEINSRLQTLLKDLHQANDEINQLQEEVEQHVQLTKRARKIEEEELRLELEKVKYQLETEKDKNSFVKEVALGLVRNTTYRENVMKNHMMEYSNGDSIPVPTGEVVNKTAE